MYYGFDIGGIKIVLGVFDLMWWLQWEKWVFMFYISYSVFLDVVCELVVEVDQ